MIKKLLKNKNVVTVLLAVAVGVLLIIFGFLKDSEPSQNNEVNQYSDAELESYTSTLEEKVEKHLEKIDGVNNVSVILTIEGTNEKVYATNGSKDYVVIKDSSGNENALMLSEINAQVRGIAVVCDYGSNEQLKQEIIAMLASLFNIGTNRISVIKG